MSLGEYMSQFWTFFKQITILTAMAKANVCKTLNQKGRIMGFHPLWYTQGMTHTAITTFFFPCILSFLNSYSRSSAFVISFLDLGTSIPVFGQSPKAHNSPLEAEGYFCKKINLYWDLVSMVKADHKKRKNPILILKLAEVWSSFLRNYIIEYCLAVQRKTYNTVIGKGLYSPLCIL